MKLYSNRETAPLKFHKLFWFVLLPIDFLFSLNDLFFLLFQQGIHSLSGIIDLFGILSITISSVICFVGFFHWKKYAWYCVIFYWCHDLIYNLAFIILASIHSPKKVGGWTEEFFLALLWVVPCVLYYYKRRPLFFTDQKHV